MGVLTVEITYDNIYSSVECCRGIFRGTRIGSGSGGEISSLVGVEDDNNDVGVVYSGEKNSLDTTVIIGRMRKEVWIDGVVFKVSMDMGREEKVIFSLVCDLNESMSKCGPGCGDKFIRFGELEEAK